MANIASNRSPSPLSSRNCRNSETNSTTRRSFNGNPFARPNALINPKKLNPPTPANTPTTTDHTKRNLMARKSTGSSLMFQDGKENHKDALRSPAKMASKNFMAPTISAASKFTPSPRKKILGEKNELTRTSIQFVDKDSELKPETSFNQTFKKNDGWEESTIVEQKENVLESSAVLEVNPNSTNESTETLSDVTDNSDFFKNRPFCCSPVSSPIVAPLDIDPHPPYDPKKNFLSPRPQYLRYKPNPRIEILLNKEGNDGYGEDDVTRLEDSFNLSENSSDTEEGEQEKEAELGDSVHGSSEISSEKVSEEQQSDSVPGSCEVMSEKVSEEKQSNSVHGSSEISSEMVTEEKQSHSEMKITSKGRVFTRSKTVSFLFVMFLVTCFSFSFTDSPPMDLPIYKDVGFSEIYHESLKFAGLAKESLDELVEKLKSWSIDFISYLSHQKSQFLSTHRISSIEFYNLSNPPIQEEILFNRHIGTDYIQEFQEELREEQETIQEEEEDYEEIEVDDDDIEVADEVVNEQSNEIQSDGGFVEEISNLEDVPVSKAGAIHEAETEMGLNDDVEIESNVADSNDEQELMTSFSTKSVNSICLAGFSMLIMAISAIFYNKKAKSNAKNRCTIGVADANMRRESCSSEMSSVQKGYKKKTNNNKRESLASSSDLSMDSPSYGSFTTFERIPIKHKDEVMLTPIRRSSRLLKNQVIS